MISVENNGPKVFYIRGVLVGNKGNVQSALNKRLKNYHPVITGDLTTHTVTLRLVTFSCRLDSIHGHNTGLTTCSSL